MSWFCYSKRRQRQPGKVQKDKAGHVAAGDLDSQELKSPDEAKQGEKKVHFVGDAAPTQVHVDLAGKGAGQHKETENVKDKGNSRTNGTSTSTSVRGGALKKGSTNLVVAEIEGQKPRRLKDSYKLGSKLGEGSYGKVRRGVSLKTGEEVAVKSILKKNIRRIETLKREIKIMLQLDHRNIVKLHDVFEDNTHLHIVMELCTGGELFDSIVEQGSYSESDAAELLQQILGAVAYLHGNHVAHRDLKPENFLFSSKDKDATLKIIDFGLSRFYKDKAYMKTRVGTPYYIAPEVLKKQYDQACDLWSVGVIMYILLCGYPPFWGNTEKDIFQRIKLGKFDYPKEEWSKISDSAKQLIERLLDVNPATRITAVEALEHPWLESKRGEKLHPGMMKKLTKFAKLNRLKRAALGVIARMVSIPRLLVSSKGRFALLTRNMLSSTRKRSPTCGSSSEPLMRMEMGTSPSQS